MTDSTSAHLRLQTWLSPAFPTGSYAYSHGLETLVSAKRISSTMEFSRWLEDIFHHGSGWHDALLLCEAWNAGMENNEARVLAANELTLALQPSKERYLETSAQGNAFDTAVKCWDRAAGFPQRASDIALPVAIGWHCGRQNIPLDMALPAWANAFLSNLVWIAVRIIPLGQSEGLKLIAAMEQKIIRLCNDAQNATLDDLGAITLAGDIASMQHETLQTRIFRS